MRQPWWSDLISFVFRASTSPEKKSTQNTKFFGQQNEGKSSTGLIFVLLIFSQFSYILAHKRKRQDKNEPFCKIDKI